MIQTLIQKDQAKNIVPVALVSQANFNNWLSHQDEMTKRWCQASGFVAEVNSFCLIPDINNAGLARVLLGVRDVHDFWAVGDCPNRLPAGDYQLEGDVADHEFAPLAWGLGSYRFDRYKQKPGSRARLIVPETYALDELQQQLTSLYLIRDLINTPTEDLGPDALAEAVINVAKEFGAEVNQIVGDELLSQNYPAIHAVGRAAAIAPRLIDLRWGDPSQPKLTLVGKGVCFDTGGLDLKPASGMLLMKKDMGGAAHALGLARMIMAAQLPVRLRLLIPAVENSVAGNAYRPGDIINTRKGISIEIGNTDAEGRVVLADALAEAVTEAPEFIIDFATLTGAARVALGPDLPVLFSNHDEFANALLAAGEKNQDFIWRLPLHKPYRDYLESPNANINNNSSQPYAGAITAALFLQEFVGDAIPWVHFDLMAWNLADRPGRPQGGEAMAVRGIFDFLARRMNRNV